MQSAALPISKYDSRNMFAGEMSAQMDVAEFGRFLDDPEKFMDAGQSLRNDGASRTVRARIGDVDLVIKRYHWPPIRRRENWFVLRLCRLWYAIRKKCYAKTSWQASFLLKSFSVQTPIPLGWVRQTRGRMKNTSWFLYEFVNGHVANDLLANPNVSRAHKEKVIASYEAVIRGLFKQRIVLRDMKPQNFLLASLESTEPIFIDFHHLRRRASLYRRQKARRKLRRVVARMQRVALGS